MSSHVHRFTERLSLPTEGRLEVSRKKKIPAWRCACGVITFDPDNPEASWEIEGVDDGYEGELPTLAEVRYEQRRYGRKKTG